MVMCSLGERGAPCEPGYISRLVPVLEAAARLGNVALRVNQRLEWDGPNLEVTNLPEANRFVTKEYREDWRYTL